MSAIFTYLPSPLEGEGALKGRMRGMVQRARCLALDLAIETPHPSLRDTFSLKGRRDRQE
jgi:hypothetical protein